MILAIFLAAAAPVSAEPDQIRFEILISGGSHSGFAIDALDQAESFDGNPHRTQREPERFSAEKGTFDLALTQLARYRSLASASDGCVAKATDVLAFRITWRESGASSEVTFADSCEGIPDDLVAALRPLGKRLDRAMPPQPDETDIVIEPG